MMCRYFEGCEENPPLMDAHVGLHFPDISTKQAMAIVESDEEVRS